MKNKLPRKKELLKIDTEQEELASKSEAEEEPVEKEDVNLIPRMIKKEALFVTFTGVIETGIFQEDDSLTAFCSIMHGVDWLMLNGEKNFTSQVASSNGKEITWNLPF